MEENNPTMNELQQKVLDLTIENHRLSQELTAANENTERIEFHYTQLLEVNKQSWLAADRSKVAELNREKKSLEEHIKKMKTENDNIESTLLKTQAELAILNNKYKSLQNLRRSAIMRRKQMAKQKVRSKQRERKFITVMEKMYSKLIEEEQSPGKQAMLSAKQQQSFSIDKECDEKGNESSSRLESGQKELNFNQDCYDTLNSENKQLIQKINDLEKCIQSLQDDGENLKNQLTNRDKEVTELNTTVQNSKKIIVARESIIAQLNSKLANIEREKNNLLIQNHTYKKHLQNGARIFQNLVPQINANPLEANKIAIKNEPEHENFELNKTTEKIEFTHQEKRPRGRPRKNLQTNHQECTNPAKPMPQKRCHIEECEIMLLNIK